MVGGSTAIGGNSSKIGPVKPALFKAKFVWRMGAKAPGFSNAEGIRDYDYKLMAKDFEMQQALRPSLTRAVFHGIISFYPGEKIEDNLMAEIATKYLQEMKIINTQFAIVKHIDKNHSHLHIIANLVNNNGETIKDNWIGLKGKKIAQKLTIEYRYAFS